MEDNRYYQKGNPEKEPLKAVADKNVTSTASNDIVLSVSMSAYTKPEASLQPKAYLIVFSGGTEREKNYFYLIKHNPLLYPDIKVDFFAEPNFEKGGKPLITSFAIDKVNEYRESASVENPDSYWLLTDVDHFEHFLTKMREDCNANGINLIISNSCFEVWLYYAEKAERCIEFKIPADKNKISSAFKTWCNFQIKGGLNPYKAILNIELNIKNAKANYMEKNGLPTLFSTQMFQLAEKMLPYVKEGNKIILAKKNYQRKRKNSEKCKFRNT